MGADWTIIEMERRINLKKYLTCMVILLSIFLFTSNKCLSESSPSTILLELQHFNLESPRIIPFASTREVINEMKRNECDKGIVLLFDTNKPIEITPTLNGVLLTHQEVTIGGTNPIVGEFDLVTRNPQTMQKLDPRMDELGIFFRFDPGSDGNAVFDASFHVKSNCYTPSPGMSMSDMIDNSLPPAYFQDSMPGLILNDEAYSSRLTYALGSEEAAKHPIELEKLSNFDPTFVFSATRAIEHLMSSLVELENLRSMLQESTIMVDMTSIQSKLGECIEKDTEAIMLLEGIKDRTPGVELLADGEFTTAVTTAQRLISEAIRCKKMVQGKIQRVEPRVGQR